MKNEKYVFFILIFDILVLFFSQILTEINAIPIDNFNNYTVNWSINTTGLTCEMSSDIFEALKCIAIGIIYVINFILQVFSVVANALIIASYLLYIISLNTGALFANLHPLLILPISLFMGFINLFAFSSVISWVRDLLKI